MDLRALVAEPERLHTSPISGERGVFFFVEVMEDERVLGDAMFGDVVRLEVNGAMHTVSVRNIRLGFPDTRPRATPFVSSPPAELVPWLRLASGKGTLGWREHVVRAGDRFRVQASRGVILPGVPLLLDVDSVESGS